MARKKADLGGGGPSWLDTYADMVTLLLTFFVLLFSMSSLDSAKWKALVVAFSGKKTPDTTSSASGEVVGGLPDENGLFPDENGPDFKSIEDVDDIKDFDDLYYYFKKYVEETKQQDVIGVHKGEGFTFIMFQNSVFFNGNSAELRPEGKRLLDIVGAAIAKVPNQIGELRVYGHTANTGVSRPLPAKIRIEDRKLSSERANNVLLYLDLKNIIDSGKMVAEGYGEYRPIVPHNGTEENMRKNRRVELYIAKTDAAMTLLDDVYDIVRKDSKTTSSK